MVKIKKYFEDIEGRIATLKTQLDNLKHRLSRGVTESEQVRLAFKKSQLSGKLEEYKLYKIIRDELPSDWMVLYDLNFVAKNSQGVLQSKQIDFMVIVPNMGVINLECKGYYYWDGAHFYPTKDSIDYDDIVGQCFEADKLFRNYCIERTKLEWAELGVYSHLLVFPSHDYDGNDFCGTPSIDGPRIRIRGALETKIRQELQNKMALHQVSFPIKSAIKIWELFSSECSPEEVDSNLVPLDKMLEEMEQDTEDHADDVLEAVLDEDHPNWKVYGSAGTGKTMLAEAFVRKYHAKYPQEKILFLCYNKLLAADLKIRFGKSIPGLALANLHDVFSAKVCDTELPIVPMSKLNPFSFEALYDSREKMAERMLASTDYPAMSQRRYDCVVIDEAQDFCRTDFAFVNSLMMPTRKCLILFSGEQKIYGGAKMFEDSWLGGSPFKTRVLRHNMRNSKMIHRYCADIAHDTNTKSRVRYVGPAPSVERAKSICEVCSNAKREGFSNENIAILTDGDPESLNVAGITLLRPAGDKVKDLVKKLREWRRGNGIWCGGLKGFKGLEAEFIIVVLKNPNTNWKDIYVACTRAKYRLVIMPGDTGIHVELPNTLAN